MHAKHLKLLPLLLAVLQAERARSVIDCRSILLK